ncbi:unnamed protein product [Adineta steineri]|uniref:guanylate cyclase n=1 Tax=Adineta steineri TaxID=433720 RepID=A0A818FPJ0_9BILA|nr:unnamed protein product [Adineta steineri]
MLYGILLESVRDGICLNYGRQIWKRIVQELNFEHETFTTFGQYDDSLVTKIAECLSDILHEETSDYYMEYFGECFVRFFTNYGYDKILRVAGRHFRDFLHSIDQLHDSNKYSFPKMKSPLFHVLQEDQYGALLQYKSRRQGFQQYVIGQLRECGTRFYNENIYVKIQENISTNQCTVVTFRVNFNNSIINEISKKLHPFPNLPNLTSETFFKIFPFSILIDSSLCISHMGKSIKNLFPIDTLLIGRYLNDIFNLIRPDITLEWNNLINYGRHIVFLMENRIPLKSLNTFNETPRINLKGQMKWISSWNLIAFLCHPVLSTTEEMLNIGLSVHDLNFYDGSSEILISGIQHARQLHSEIDKQQAWVSKLQTSKLELKQWREKGRHLLYSLMPRHIGIMLQQGIVPNSICESHKLVTVLFCYTLDFKDVIQKLSPTEIVQSINEMIIVFDQCTEKYDVFKVETKADSSYMLVSGIQQRISQRRISDRSDSSDQSYSLIDDNFNNEINHKKTNINLNQGEIISGLAIDLLKESKKLINKITKESFQIKIGFHSGSAVGGIVGHKNYQYCLFGDTINTASRITATSDIGRIHLSETSWQLLKDSMYFETSPRGKIPIKGKGEMETHWLINSKEAFIKEMNKYESTTNNNQNLSSLSDIHSTIVENNQRKKSLPNVINKRTSFEGICPFSYHK